MNVLLVLVFLALAGAGRKPVDPLKVEEPVEVPPVDTAPQPTEVKMYHPSVNNYPLVLDSTNPVDFSNMTDPNKYYLGFTGGKHDIAGVPSGTLYVWRPILAGLNVGIEPYNPERYY